MNDLNNENYHSIDFKVYHKEMPWQYSGWSYHLKPTSLTQLQMLFLIAMLLNQLLLHIGTQQMTAQVHGACIQMVGDVLEFLGLDFNLAQSKHLGTFGELSSSYLDKRNNSGPFQWLWVRKRFYTWKLLSPQK